MSGLKKDIEKGIRIIVKKGDLLMIQNKMAQEMWEDLARN
jgi:hypothetical protein